MTGRFRLLQHQLAHLYIARNADRVLAVETGAAELILVEPHGLYDTTQRKEAEGGGPDDLPNLLHRVACCHELGLVRHIDPVVAWMPHGRGADSHVYLQRAGIE